MSFDECARILLNGAMLNPEEREFAEQRQIQILAHLERKLLQAIRFKLNQPTALDFLLVHAFGAFGPFDAASFVEQALPYLYWIETNYERSRNVTSSAVGLACLQYVLLKDEEMLNCIIKETYTQLDQVQGLVQNIAESEGMPQNYIYPPLEEEPTKDT